MHLSKIIVQRLCNNPGKIMSICEIREIVKYALSIAADNELSERLAFGLMIPMYALKTILLHLLSQILVWLLSTNLMHLPAFIKKKYAELPRKHSKHQS